MLEKKGKYIAKKKKKNCERVLVPCLFDCKEKYIYIYIFVLVVLVLLLLLLVLSVTEKYIYFLFSPVINLFVS